MPDLMAVTEVLRQARARVSIQLDADTGRSDLNEPRTADDWRMGRAQGGRGTEPIPKLHGREHIHAVMALRGRGKGQIAVRIEGDARPGVMSSRRQARALVERIATQRRCGPTATTDSSSFTRLHPVTNGKQAGVPALPLWCKNSIHLDSRKYVAYSRPARKRGVPERSAAVGTIRKPRSGSIAA